MMGLQLCSFVPMPRGTLLVSYVGLPLITTRLSYKDCLPIFNEIQQKNKIWAAKKLSYAGRVQLIISVLSGVHQDQTSVFLLPKAVVRRIESMLVSFLWAAELETHYAAKMSWKDTCKRKKVEGLGIKGDWFVE